MPTLSLTPDELLSTTRAVRKRLDLERPVERLSGLGCELGHDLGGGLFVVDQRDALALGGCLGQAARARARPPEAAEPASASSSAPPSGPACRGTTRPRSRRRRRQHRSRSSGHSSRRRRHRPSPVRSGSRRSPGRRWRRCSTLRPGCARDAARVVVTLGAERTTLSEGCSRFAGGAINGLMRCRDGYVSYRANSRIRAAWPPCHSVQ